MSRRIGLRTAIAAVMALIIAPWFAATASADQDAAPVAPATGDLVIHKYVGAPVGGNATGEQLDTTGWTGVAPAAGVKFDLYLVGAPVDPAAWPDVPPQGTYVRNKVSGNLEVFQASTLVGEYYLQPAATPTVTTAAGGVGAATGLPRGIYLVIENRNDHRWPATNADTGEAMYISQVAAPFLVAVPMTAPDGSGWLDVVHVYPKNEPMTIAKAVETAGAVMVGDKVTYTITASVPSRIAESKTLYVISDRMELALDPDLSSVAVDALVASAEPYSLIKGTDFKVDYLTESRDVAVVILDPGKIKLDQASGVVVTFDAYVNDGLLQAPGLTILNTAYGQFNPPEGGSFTSMSNTVTIDSAAIRVTKVDQAGQPLSGSSFKIASTQANAKAGNFLRLDPVTSVLYDFDADAASDWTRLGTENDYTINPSNQAEFVGMRDRADVDGTLVWQTYWVVETSAPAGYNLLADPIEVSFENAFDQFADPADYDHVAILTVTNSKGFILPVTGGAGTVWLTVVGVVLIGAAVLVGVTRKKAESA